jgi:hypothetical protein
LLYNFRTIYTGTTSNHELLKRKEEKEEERSRPVNARAGGWRFSIRI